MFLFHQNNQYGCYVMEVCLYRTSLIQNIPEELTLLLRYFWKLGLLLGRPLVLSLEISVLNDMMNHDQHF